MRRIIAVFLLILTVLLGALPSFAANDTLSSIRPLDMTSVETDFKSANFDTDRFIKNLENKNAARIATIAEYKTKDARYIYVYVYTPHSISGMGERIFDFGSAFELATNIGDDGRTLSTGVYYAKYIGYTADKLFQKFRITIENGDQLFYLPIRFSEFMLTGNDGSVSAASGFEQSYYFPGDGTMKVHYDKVYDLETTSTVYRTATSDKGVGYRYDIFSVYFTIEKELYEKYDSLNGISYKHKEKLWNAVVTSNNDLHSKLSTMLGQTFSEETFRLNRDYPSVYASYSYSNSFGMGYSFAINPGGGSRWGGEVVDSKLLNLFLVDADEYEDVSISQKEITNDFDYTEGGAASEIVVDTTYSNELFDINSYSGNDPGIIKQLLKKWHYGDVLETQISGVKPIEIFKDASGFEGYKEGINDDVYANKYLVHQSDLSGFKKALESAKSNGDYVVLFRFAVRDYYAEECRVFLNDKSVDNAFEDDCFYARGTVFRDFNVISLTFRKENIDYVVLVNNDEQDIGGGITSPNHGKGSDDGPNYLKMILMIVAVFAVVVILIKIISLFKPAHKAKVVINYDDVEKKKPHKKKKE